MITGRSWPQLRRWIFAGTAVYLGGAAIFAVLDRTADLRRLAFYARVPGALLLVALSAVSFCLSCRVSREFSPGEPLSAGWRLIALAAGLDLLGEIAVQIFGTESILNPLTGGGGVYGIHEWGLFVSGPCRFVALAAGLLFVLEIYRRTGFLGRLRLFDWGLLTMVSIYVAVEAGVVVMSIRQGKGPSFGEVLRYPTDPLLLLLLWEALVIYRSVQSMGNGSVGRCWKSFSAGIFWIVFGDVLLLATAYEYLPWPWSAVGWFVWYPAAALFAAAPAYQAEAIALAQSV